MPDFPDGVGDDDRAIVGFAVSFLIVSELVSGGAGGPDFFGSRSFEVRGREGGDLDVGEEGKDVACLFFPATIIIACEGPACLSSGLGVSSLSSRSSTSITSIPFSSRSCLSLVIVFVNKVLDMKNDAKPDRCVDI